MKPELRAALAEKGRCAQFRFHGVPSFTGS